MKIESGFWKDWKVYITDKSGNALPEYRSEYDPPVDGNPAIARLFVECVHDAEFGIVVERPPTSSRECRVSIWLDGHNMRKVAYRNRDYGKFSIREVFESCNGVVMTKSLKFSKLHHTEDGPMIDMPTAVNLGTVGVNLKSGFYRPSTVEMPDGVQGGPSVINEKVKKSRVGSCVGGDYLGPATPMQHYTLTPDGGPGLEVHFTYATREALMADDVIENPDLPRAPSPVGDVADNKPPVPNGLHDPNSSNKRARSETPSDDGDGILAVEDVAPKKRKIHTIDLTNDSKPPIFINLATDSSDDDEPGSSNPSRRDSTVKAEH